MLRCGSPRPAPAFSPAPLRISHNCVAPSLRSSQSWCSSMFMARQSVSRPSCSPSSRRWEGALTTSSVSEARVDDGRTDRSSLFRPDSSSAMTLVSKLGECSAAGEGADRTLPRQTGQISDFLEMDDFKRRFAQCTDPSNPDTCEFSNVRTGLIVAMLSIGTLFGSLVGATQVCILRSPHCSRADPSYARSQSCRPSRPSLCHRCRQHCPHRRRCHPGCFGFGLGASIA